MLDNDREQVLVDHPVGDADTLARMLYRLSPDPGVPELLGEFPVELVADILNSTPPAYDEGLLEIGIASVRF